MKKGYILVLSTAIISGFAIFINQFGVKVINPYVFTFLKNVSVAVFLTTVLLLLKDWSILKKITKKQWSFLILIGLIGGCIPFLLFFKGLSLSTGIKGAFLHKTMFAYIFVLAFVFLKEKIDKRFLIGGLLLFIANVFLLKQIPYSITIGDILISVAVLFWAVENILSKHVLKELPGRTVAWARMFFGSLFIFVFLLFTGQATLMSGLGLNQIIWVGITGLLLFGYVMTWYTGLKHVPVSHAGVILLLGLPITSILSLVYTKQITGQDIVAGVFLLLGIMTVIGFSKVLKKISLGYVRD